MLIATAEGEGWRYEVVAEDDGFHVRLRDKCTGAVDADSDTLFRTAPVAFAFAAAMAALDRYEGADGRNDDEREAHLNEAVQLEHEFNRKRLSFRDEPWVPIFDEDDSLTRRATH